MNNYRFQPQHNFVWIDFVVVTDQVQRKHFGDDILKALEYCREYRKSHPYWETHVYDESCGRNNVTLDYHAIEIY